VAEAALYPTIAINGNLCWDAVDLTKLFETKSFIGAVIPSFSWNILKIAKALLTPLSSNLFIVVNAGANLEQLLLMSISDINDVPNAPRATALVPTVPDDALFVPLGRRSGDSGGASARREVGSSSPNLNKGEEDDERRRNHGPCDH
jgi:hypothetical protein